MPYQGSEFDSRVVLSQEAKISALSKNEVITVGTTAKKLNLTTGEPTNEMTIFLCGHPSIADVIYVGLTNAVTTAENWFLTISPNEKVSLTLNSDTPPELWAIGTNAADKIGVLKGL